MKCKRCGGQFTYLCCIRSAHDLEVNGILLFDKNSPHITFAFECRYCDNRAVVVWAEGQLEMTQNYGTPKSRYFTLQKLENT